MEKPKGLDDLVAGVTALAREYARLNGAPEPRKVVAPMFLFYDDSKVDGEISALLVVGPSLQPDEPSMVNPLLLKLGAFMERLVQGGANTEPEDKPRVLLN